MDLFRDPIWEGLSAIVALLGVIIALWLFIFPTHRNRLQALLSHSINPSYLLVILGLSGGLLIASILKSNGYYSPYIISIQFIGASIGFLIALVIVLIWNYRNQLANILQHPYAKYSLFIIFGVIVGGIVATLYINDRNRNQIYLLQQQYDYELNQLRSSNQSTSIASNFSPDCVKPNIVDVLSSSLFDQEMESYYIVGECMFRPRVTLGGVDIPYNQISPNVIHIAELPTLSENADTEIIVSNAIPLLRDNNYIYVLSDDIEDELATSIPESQLRLFQDSISIPYINSKDQITDKIWGTSQIYILGNQNGYFGDLYSPSAKREVIRFELENFEDIQGHSFYLLVQAVGIVSSDELKEDHIPTRVSVNSHLYDLSSIWPYSGTRNDYAVGRIIIPIDNAHLTEGTNLIALEAGELGSDLDDFVVDEIKLFTSR